MPAAELADHRGVPYSKSNPLPISPVGGGSDVTLYDTNGVPLGTLTNPLIIDASTNQPVNLSDGSGNPISSTGGKLDIAGSFSSTPTYSNTVSNGGLITVTTSAVLLAQNLSRVGWQIQNISTTVIFVLYGAGTASATNYTFALPACGTAGDGSSPIYRDIQWQGAIQFAAAAGTGKVAYGEYQ